MNIIIALIGALAVQDDVETLRRQLETLQRQDAERREQMQALEARLQALESGTPARTPEAAVEWNELVLGESRIKFYGFLRMDMFYDDSQPNQNKVIGFIRSEDPGAPIAIRETNAGSFTMHPRLTRFGFNLDGPTIDFIDEAKVTGKFEIDFYNIGLAGQSESRAALRMRHAYVQLQWPEVGFIAGQREDIISPLYPVVNNDMVMWGAGNLGDRRPQTRLWWYPKAGDGTFKAEFMAGMTGADDNQDLDLGTVGTVFLDGEYGTKPTFQLRLAYNHPTWVEKQNAEFAVWGHRAWEETDIAILGERDFDSYALGADWLVPLAEWLEVRGEVWVGQNVDDVRGGIFQGINAATGEEIDAAGGWAELVVKPVDWYKLHLGFSTDDPDDGDLPAVGRALNRIYYIGNRFKVGKSIDLGFDYLNWTTEFRSFGEGDDNRVAAFIQYNF